MRRFSQRNSLVTLSDINITPLLDLAFVLLIIFIIATPLIEQGLELKPPKGGKPDRVLRRDDFRTVEVGQNFYLMNGRRMTLAQLEPELVKEQRANPNVILFLRADKATPWDSVFQLQDLCANRGIAISLRAEPKGKP